MEVGFLRSGRLLGSGTSIHVGDIAQGKGPEACAGLCVKKQQGAIVAGVGVRGAADKGREVMEPDHRGPYHLLSFYVCYLCSI